jgi:4-amino-4-deoxy-L-arabinose transferase-like glycosyltransferase
MGFDEYQTGIRPAGMKLLLDPAYVFTDAARSPILYYLDYYLFLLASKTFGITSPVWLLRFAMMVVGLFSSLMIYMAYRISLLVNRDDNNALTVASLFAFYFAMPFIGTRLMSEALSSFFVIAAVYFATRSWRMDDKGSNIFLSGLLFGVAAMFRFQAGLLFMGMLLFLSIYDLRHRAKWLLFGGVLALILQIILDYATFGGFLTSIFGYVKFQMQVLATHSSQPWYNFILLLFGLTLPIATITTLPAFLRSCARHLWLCVPLAFFVIFHCFSPHKEERFMFPIIPLFILMMGLGMKKARGFWSKFSAYWFWSVNGILLFLVIFSPTLSNVTEPMDYVRRSGFEVFASDSPLVPDFFVAYFGKTDVVDRYKWKSYLCALDKNKKTYIHTVFQQDETKLEASAQECGIKLIYIDNFRSGLADRIVAKLNPTFNRRRVNGYLYVVDRTGS